MQEERTFFLSRYLQRLAQILFDFGWRQPRWMRWPRGMKFVRICGDLRKILLGYENLVPEPDVMSGLTGIETDGDRTVGALQSQRPPDSRLGDRVGRPHNQTAGGCRLPRSAQRRWPCRAGVAGVASRRWLHGNHVPVPDRYRLFRAWLETGRQHWSKMAAARWLCASAHRTVRCERCGQSSRLQHGRAVRGRG